MFIFQQIWCALFSWNTRFEIHPFALFPTNPSSNKRGGGCIYYKKVLGILTMDTQYMNEYIVFKDSLKNNKEYFFHYADSLPNSTLILNNSYLILKSVYPILLLETPNFCLKWVILM